MPAPFRWTSPNPDETLRAGTLLGRASRPGDFLALSGPLGSGKTLFVKGVARGLSVADWDLVASPTFALVSQYAGTLLLVHVDAYRLHSAEELLDLGAESWIAEDGVTAFEWAAVGGSGPCPGAGIGKGNNFLSSFVE
jgi:tRNA threonylcarbamoyladenosine biosynthesis protein TsaE